MIEAIEKTWPGQELRPLIQAAATELAAAGRVDRDVVKGWAVEASKHVFNKMLEIGDYAGSLRAIRQVMELAGK